MRRRLTHGLLLVAVALAGTGCGADVLKDDRSALSPRCEVVPEDVAAHLASRIDGDEPTSLRSPHMVQAEDVTDRWFVSAELVVAGREKDAGRIGTWVTTGRPSPASEFAAVDEDARTNSTWPDGPDDLEVTADGVYPSRQCADHYRPER